MTLPPLFLSLLLAIAVAHMPQSGSNADPRTASGAGVSSQLPATIIVIRHAEKPAAGASLSALGALRAKRLPEAFGGPSAAPPHNLPIPTHLFAASTTRKSNRPVETLIPLSEALRLPIERSLGNGEHKKLAKLLLGGKYAGQVVVVSWRHDTIPELARALGAKPPYKTWPDERFDRAWRIDYGQSGPVLTDVPLALLNGDSQ